VAVADGPDQCERPDRQHDNGLAAGVTKEPHFALTHRHGFSLLSWERPSRSEHPLRSAPAGREEVRPASQLIAGPAARQLLFSTKECAPVGSRVLSECYIRGAGWVMAILQLILTSIFRSLGKILNTAFGWATALLFGKVPEKRQLYLSAIALGSILWWVVLLGVLFPRFAAFLLAFVPMQSIVHAWWVRIVMLVAAVLLPAGVGVLSRVPGAPDPRPKTAEHGIRP